MQSFTYMAFFLNGFIFCLTARAGNPTLTLKNNLMHFYRNVLKSYIPLVIAFQESLDSNTNFSLSFSFLMSLSFLKYLDFLYAMYIASWENV